VEIVLILIVVLGGIGGAIYYFMRQARIRSESVEAIAASQGLRFSKKGSSTDIPEINSLKLFSRGWSNKYTNLLFGEREGRNITLFDYYYRTGRKPHALDGMGVQVGGISIGTGGGRRRRGRQNNAFVKQTVACVSSGSHNFPMFYIKPKNLWDKFKGFTGFSNLIRFDDLPDHAVYGDDGSQVIGLLNHRVVEYFKQNPKLEYEAAKSTLVAYTPKSLIKPEHWLGFLEEVEHVFSLFDKTAMGAVGDRSDRQRKDASREIIQPKKPESGNSGGKLDEW